MVAKLPLPSRIIYSGREADILALGCVRLDDLISRVMKKH